MAKTSPKRTSAPGGGRASAPGGDSFDFDTLRSVLDLFENSNLSRLHWQQGEKVIELEKGGARQTVVASPPPPPALSVPRPSAPTRSTSGAAPEKKGHLLTSPFVGTFYRAPAPDQPNYVDVGTAVKKGQVLCIVEAMKLMNEIESEVAGRVAEVLVENGQPVEFGQALFRLEPV